MTALTDAALTGFLATLTINDRFEIEWAAADKPQTHISWTGTLKQKAGMMNLLLDRIRHRFIGYIDTAALARSKDARDNARLRRFYEKDFLLKLLETWMIEHFKDAAPDIPPHNGVPLLILHRLHAFEVNEREGGSVRKYMLASEASHDPKDFLALRKEALKKSPATEDADT